MARSIPVECPYPAFLILVSYLIFYAVHLVPEFDDKHVREVLSRVPQITQEVMEAAAAAQNHQVVPSLLKNEERIQENESEKEETKLKYFASRIWSDTCILVLLLL